MHLTPRELDKLMIYMMAEVALKRKGEGLEAESSRSCGGDYGLSVGRGTRREILGAGHERSPEHIDTK